MTVFGGNVGGGGGGGGRQVFPVDYGAEVSQRLVEAAHGGDLAGAEACISDPFVDVNFAGAVVLKSRRAEIVPLDESPAESRTVSEEFRTDVSALFLAAHIGNLALLRKLINAGADVNQKLFRGHAAAAAAREGHKDALEVLIRAGASQEACEEALLEAARHGRAGIAAVLMGSDMAKPHTAVRALVTAACHGHVEVVDTLMKTGVRRDIKVSLGAWSWDTTTGEEFRVGAGLAEPYDATWCAIEYFDSTGRILQSLLLDHPINAPHLGRTLLHHAVLCDNPRAVSILLELGADPELLIKTDKGSIGFGAMHMAARLGLAEILQRLIKAGCDVNARTSAGETSLMLCARYAHGECLRILASAGADFGLTSPNGTSVEWWSIGFANTILEAIRSGAIVRSSDATVFSPIAFIIKFGDAEALHSSIAWPGTNLDEQDKQGFSPLMIAATEGDVEAFRALVFAGADVTLTNDAGETAISIAQRNKNRDAFDKVMLEHALHNNNPHALHCAARQGDTDSVQELLRRLGHGDVNAIDGEGYTALMLAARGGHAETCEALMAMGAGWDYKTVRGETALTLARGGAAEGVVMDGVGRGLVRRGGWVRKYTREGKGKAHRKWVEMEEGVGKLRWGRGGGGMWCVRGCGWGE
ncbi:hypothetical protein QJS10_CPA16g00190 [Acorus calamus]|uniref:Ankyrin n=1 Tax=Acorus calamus TaxID=4465 RepID=A0AAV9CZ51_ACOCL|nr:hypothetical protein QJS10_CPA16g00190 [Acorus calamus]